MSKGGDSTTLSYCSVLSSLTAKYPYLRLNVPGEQYEGVKPGKFRDVLCFGSVPVGTTVEKCVEIFNLSVVCGEGDYFL